VIGYATGRPGLHRSNAHCEPGAGGSCGQQHLATAAIIPAGLPCHLRANHRAVGVPNGYTLRATRCAMDLEQPAAAANVGGIDTPGRHLCRYALCSADSSMKRSGGLAR
jgi:hypothetical protein